MPVFPIYNEGSILCGDPYRQKWFQDMVHPYPNILSLTALGLQFEPETLCRHLYDLCSLQDGRRILSPHATLFVHSHKECAVGPDALKIALEVAEVVKGVCRFKVVATHLDEKEGPEITANFSGVRDHEILRHLQNKKAKWKPFTADTSIEPNGLMVTGRYCLGHGKNGEARAIAGLMMNQGIAKLLRHVFPRGVPKPDYRGVTPEQKERVEAFLKENQLLALQPA